MSDSKEKLKRRIVRLLAETKSGRQHSTQSLERIADDVLDLFQKRVNAPAGKKRQVWADGEERILRELGRAELKQAAVRVARARSSA